MSPKKANNPGKSNFAAFFGKAASVGGQTANVSSKQLSEIFEDSIQKYRPLEKRADKYLSEREKNQKSKILQAKSTKVSDADLDSLLKSKAHAVQEAALSNPKLTSEQISFFAEHSVDLEKWGGSYTHEHKCLILILKHPNTPAEILQRVTTFDWSLWKSETAELVFTHPNCPQSLLDAWMHEQYGRMRPFIAKSPHISISQAEELLVDKTRRLELEKSVPRWKEGAYGGLSVSERHEGALKHISQEEAECHVSLAENKNVPLNILRQIPASADTKLVTQLAKRFEGSERETLLDQLELLAPKSKDTQLTIAKLSNDPTKLSKLCAIKNKAVLKAVASNPATLEEDKVLLALMQ